MQDIIASSNGVDTFITPLLEIRRVRLRELRWLGPHGSGRGNWGYPIPGFEPSCPTAVSDETQGRS